MTSSSWSYARSLNASQKRVYNASDMAGSLLDEVGGLLADHDARGVGVAGGDPRDPRRGGAPQPGDAVAGEVRPDLRAERAGAVRVPQRAGVSTDEVDQV